MLVSRISYMHVLQSQAATYRLLNHSVSTDRVKRWETGLEKKGRRKRAGSISCAYAQVSVKTSSFWQKLDWGFQKMFYLNTVWIHLASFGLISIKNNLWSSWETQSATTRPLIRIRASFCQNKFLLTETWLLPTQKRVRKGFVHSFSLHLTSFHSPFTEISVPVAQCAIT